MCPSFNSFGSLPSVSQLVWDTDLVIPAGKAIESAGGEVGINGDVSISGNLGTEGTITTAQNLVGLNAVIAGKQLVVNDNNFFAGVKLSQPPTNNGRYTSADFAISAAKEGVQYIIPPVTYTYDTNVSAATVTFSIQGKLASGTYQTISTVSNNGARGSGSISTQPGIIPAGITALRYVTSANAVMDSCSITSDLTLTLTPLPVYAQED